MRKSKFQRALPWLLLCLGLVQMFASVLGIKPLQALASATGASPRPKVFSAVRGLETFSSQFDLKWRDKCGENHTLRISPIVYSTLRGPYNRRNVYGAAFAYGPILAADKKYGQPILHSVLEYSLRKPDIAGAGKAAPLLRELNIDPDQVDLNSVHIVLSPRPGSSPESELPLIIRLDQDLEHKP